ncbi:NADH-quinone oxidoreductase subunit I [Cesiribacter sp. SM1]|uniref:NuoI/complex I 23 kDa subunit family protein n=1 Tax=Cesiribacter sp. SM1 TaxID=2861196 RepID=UPI001CD35563|nr:NADH-quinone oxidoreductase subunit I [Cesiribacter sp. SM1]
MATEFPKEQPQQGPQINRNTYFGNMGTATRTLLHGLKLTWRHFLESRQSRKPVGVEQDNYFEQQTGIFTLQYPKESLPVPDNARYRLHNEIEDCIVCDKCAKVCPVDCIEIEPIKAVETSGQTSDGTPKRIHAARFDIDMAKCCFCGLCTTVCPTECLTMTKVYDFSEFDVADHTYAFAEMSPLEILQKRKELEEHQAQKEAQKAARPAAAAAKPAVAKPSVARPASARPASARPVPSAARPAAPKPVAPSPATPKPAAPKPADAEANAPETAQDTARKLMEQKKAAEAATGMNSAAEAPNPTMKSAPTPAGTEDSPAPGAEKPKFRPRPMMKPKAATSDAGEAKPSASEEASAALPASSTTGAAPKPRPVMKPVVKKAAPPAGEEKGPAQQASAAPARPRPVMKPVVKKASPPENIEASATDQPKDNSVAPEAQQTATPPRPRPVMKPKPVVKKADPAAASTDANVRTETAGASPENSTKGSAEDPSQADAPVQAKPASARPRPVMKPVIRKTETPEATNQPLSDEPMETSGGETKKPRPVIKPVIPKQQAMQADETPSQKEANEQENKGPKPVVDKKVVIRKPEREALSEEEKRQDDSQRPEPPGRAG